MTAPSPLPGPHTTTPLLELGGRVALVTGAAGGIGRACTLRLAAAGAKVRAVDLDAPGLVALAEQARDLAGTVEPHVLDLTDLDAAEHAAAGTDVLVNNAGLQLVRPIEEFPPEVFHTVLTVMLEAPFRLIRGALPHMYAQEWGRIVNVSSVHGLRASAFKSAYVAAKHGLEGLSKTAALEGVHVHVNTVAQRLERVGRLLGEDWQDPARTLEIQLALRLHRLAAPGRR